MFRNLIFDWSGTLCDDMALTIEATNYVLAQYGREPLDRQQFRNEFQLPYGEYYEVKVPEAKLEELENHYRHSFDNSSTGVTLLPYAREFLEFCAARGIRCFALTSMDKNAFDEQVTQLGVKHFFEAIHSGIQNKEHYIPGLMARHGLAPEDTAFIGDMQHDINAAHCVGICSIGVLTGYNNPCQLHEAAPQIVVPHLASLQALMQRAPMPAQDTIRLNWLEFQAHIGVPDEEREQPQKLCVNVDIVPPKHFAAMQEEVSNTINYDCLSRRLVALAQEEPTKLIETLAHKLATCCVEEYGALSATVELHKFIMPNMATSAVRCTVKKKY